MKPQDVVVSVKLALASPQGRPTYPELAAALEMSLSEVHGAVKRATAAGLVDASRRANRVALLDFLAQGLKSAFVPKRGPLTRGMPTAHGAPPLDQLVGLGAEPAPVWPDPEGAVRGESFEPLYRSVPKAAKKDPKLYEALCLIDALRGGRPRDRALAEEHLRKLLNPASTTSTKFSPNDPRRRRIEEALSRTIGPGTAEFYRSATELLAADHPVPATSHLVAHLATEIESSIKDLILDVMAATPQVTNGSTSIPQKSPGDGNHANAVRAVLAWLEIPIDGPIGRDWLGLTGKDNQEAFNKRRHRDALQPPRPIDWTFWARFEGILTAVLEAFEKKYVSVFERLDQLATKSAPNEEDAKEVRGKLPQNSTVQEYFFGKLSEPAWIRPLEQVGFFARPPEPVRKPDGVEHPAWPALHFLARMAAASPDDVARVALAVPKTDNVHVCATLVGIAQSLPAKLAAPFADRIDEWLDVGPSHHAVYPLIDNVIGLFEKLATEGHEAVALRMLAALLRPIAPLKDEAHAVLRRDPEARLPHWDLDRTMQRLSSTIQRLGKPALEVLASLLAQALAMTRQNGTDEWEDYSWTWRKEMEEHGENHNGTLSSHLVSLTRDSSIRLIETDATQLSDLVTSFENRRWVLFRRLALYLLGRFSVLAPHLAVPRILDRACFDLPGPEYARLLRVCFKSLTPEQQETILAWIDGGPELYGAADTDNYGDTWRARRLAIISESLPESWRERYEALKAKVGDVRAADAVPSSRERFVRPVSPFRHEVLAQMTPAQVVDTIAAWKPTSESGRQEREALSHSLARVVEQLPDQFAASAGELERLPPMYLPAAIRGFSAAVQAGRAFDWKPLVDLCAWVASHPRRPPGRESHDWDNEAYWRNARFGLLWLLSDAMNAGSVPIPIELREAVWSAIAPTLDDPNGAEGSRDVQSDPLSVSMNRVRGVAVLAAVDYARWLARGRATKGLPEEVRQALDVKVREDSVAVRAALADRIDVLASLDEAWCEAHTPELFKPDEQGRDIAWETYLEYEELFSLETFHVLRWRYGIAIERLRSDVPLDKRTQEAAEAIGKHLGRLYWHGRIGFGERDSLLDKFFSNAPASVTGRLMEEIGRWLHTDGQPMPEVLARLKALWAGRVAVGRPEELAVFGWWFSSGCFDEAWSIDNFHAALQALDALAAGVLPRLAPKVGERLAELVPKHLPKVAACLELLVKANEGGWAILSLRIAARTILAAALASGDEGARQVAETTINLLARRGYMEFRDLLP